MQLSKRLDLFGDEVFAYFNQKRRELESEGRRVFDLSVGTPDFATPDYIKRALVDSAADDANWKYSCTTRTSSFRLSATTTSVATVSWASRRTWS